MQEITRDSHTELLQKLQIILDKVDYNEHATVTIVKVKKNNEIKWKTVIMIQ